MSVSEIGRGQVAVYALVVAVVAFLGARALRAPVVDGPSGPPPAADVRPSQPGSSSAGSGAPDGTSGAVAVTRADGGRVLVHVAGAVRRPGVYRMQEGDRVADAVRRAGGPRSGADLDAVNLAGKVNDAQQVLVPRRVVAGATASGGAASAAGAGGGEAAAAPEVPLNLNTATLEQLDTLDGVGPSTAQKIIDERTRRGGFRSVDDLAQVPGIGPKRLASLREQVRV